MSESIGAKMFYQWHGEAENDISRIKLWQANIEDVKNIKRSFIDEMKLVVNDDSVDFGDAFWKAMIDLGCDVVLSKLLEEDLKAIA